MLQDDLIYALLLFVSIAVGHFVSRGADPSQRRILYTSLGFLLTVLVSGPHVVHPLITTIVNAIIIGFCDKRYCHVVSFIFCFSYLGFFRTCHWLGIPSPPNHTNAIQMVLTLKMIGAAFEVNQDWKAKKQQNSKELKEVEQSRTFNPSPIDVFHYAFCYAGVLIGPYYRYSTYWDMLHAPYRAHLPCLSFLKQRLSPVPLYILLYLISQYLFPLQYAMSEEIMDRSLTYRIFYMTPIFFNFRMRIYTGFILGECVCIMAGLGIYPEASRPEPGAGPLDLRALKKFEGDAAKWQHGHYSCQTIHNIDEYSSEFLPTVREGIRSWNKTVQYWLVVFVHKQLPYSKTIRMVITMGTSAFWHGVHPGYYLCLMSAPLFLLAEAEVHKALKGRLGVQGHHTFNWLWWMLKMQAFGYMGMAFLLLRIDATLYFWKSIYFVGHVLAVVFLLVGRFVGPSPRRLKEKYANEQ